MLRLRGRRVRRRPGASVIRPTPRSTAAGSGWAGWGMGGLRFRSRPRCGVGVAAPGPLCRGCYYGASACLGWHWYPTATPAPVTTRTAPPSPRFRAGWPSSPAGAGRGLPGSRPGPWLPAGHRADQPLRRRRPDGPAPRQRRGRAGAGGVVEHQCGPCLFRLGNTEHRGRPWTDVELHSGESRRCSATRAGWPTTGCRSCCRATPVPDTGLASGRLNITLRVSGREPGPPPATG